MQLEVPEIVYVFIRDTRKITGLETLMCMNLTLLEGDEELNLWIFCIDT